jgi:ABC-type multidrug transport system fused ATPase/permease subunit
LQATAVFAIFILVGSLLFTIGGFRASQAIHKDTMSRMLQAPYSWYQDTPVGRITSRFTTDLGLVDIQLSLWCDNLAQMGSQYLAMVGLIVYIIP